MRLSWLGLSAFKIEMKDTVLVTDPFAPAHAAKAMRAKADIVTVSAPMSDAHNHVAAIFGEPFVIDCPGEFEVKGVYVQGIGMRGQVGQPDGFSENILRGPRTAPSAGRPAGSERRTASSPAEAPATATAFTFDLEGMRLAHLGDLRSFPDADLLEKLDGVDVLFLPVGGGTTLEPDAAMKVVNAVEPRVVVPMHFRAEGFRDKLLGADAFLREIGASKVEPVERATMKKRDLGEEGTTVMLFQASGG